MKHFVPSIVLWLSGSIMLGQSPAGQRADMGQGKLFRLASASDVIVIGTVIRAQGIAKRLDPSIKILDDLSKTLGGRLYTISVEAVMCAQTDFIPGVARPNLAGKNIFIFIERDAPMYRDGNEREDFIVNARYLIALVAKPAQADLPVVYQLDAGQTYYRSLDGRNGVFSLADDKLPMLDILRRFCEALQPVDLQLKLKKLNDLRHVSNADLRLSAEAAIRLLMRKIDEW